MIRNYLLVSLVMNIPDNFIIEKPICFIEANLKSPTLSVYQIDEKSVVSKTHSHGIPEDLTLRFDIKSIHREAQQKSVLISEKRAFQRID